MHSCTSVRTPRPRPRAAPAPSDPSPPQVLEDTGPTLERHERPRRYPCRPRPLPRPPRVLHAFGPRPFSGACLSAILGTCPAILDRRQTQ